MRQLVPEVTAVDIEQQPEILSPFSLVFAVNLTGLLFENTVSNDMLSENVITAIRRCIDLGPASSNWKPDGLVLEIVGMIPILSQNPEGISGRNRRQLSSEEGNVHGAVAMSFGTTLKLKLSFSDRGDAPPLCLEGYAANGDGGCTVCRTGTFNFAGDDPAGDQNTVCDDCAASFSDLTDNHGALLAHSSWSSTRDGMYSVLSCDGAKPVGVNNSASWKYTGTLKRLCNNGKLEPLVMEEHCVPMDCSQVLPDESGTDADQNVILGPWPAAAHGDRSVIDCASRAGPVDQDDQHAYEGNITRVCYAGVLLPVTETCELQSDERLLTAGAAKVVGEVVSLSAGFLGATVVALSATSSAAIATTSGSSTVAAAMTTSVVTGATAAGSSTGGATGAATTSTIASSGGSMMGIASIVMIANMQTLAIFSKMDTIDDNAPLFQVCWVSWRDLRCGGERERM